MHPMPSLIIYGTESNSLSHKQSKESHVLGVDCVGGSVTARFRSLPSLASFCSSILSYWIIQVTLQFFTKLLMMWCDWIELQ